MTNIQEMMLAICFGCCTGIIIGNTIFLVTLAITSIVDKIRKHKEKKRKRKTTTLSDKK